MFKSAFVKYPSRRSFVHTKSDDVKCEIRRKDSLYLSFRLLTITYNGLLCPELCLL